MDILLNKTLTSKGQVTIPLQIRKLLGLKPYEKVTFKIENNKVEIKPYESIVDKYFGAAKPLQKSMTMKKMKKIAMDDKIEKEKHLYVR